MAAEPHPFAMLHDHVADRVAKSESTTRKAIDQAIGPLKNEIAQLRQAVQDVVAKQQNADPALTAAVRAYVEIAVASALDADARSAAQANKLFVDALIAKALGPLVARIKALEVKKVGG